MTEVAGGALEIPPVKDGLIIGRDAAIGADAMLRTLGLTTNEKSERIAIKDHVVQDINFAPRPTSI